MNYFSIREKSFNWKTDCFFCKEVCVVDKKHPIEGWHEVGTLSFQTFLLNKCHERTDK